jgi:hypothetical protein
MAGIIRTAKEGSDWKAVNEIWSLPCRGVYILNNRQSFMFTFLPCRGPHVVGVKA